MAKKKAAAAGDAPIVEFDGTSVTEIDVFILGATPLLLNRLKEDTAHELLFPAPKKNQAERAMRLKHHPYQEFRDSVYRSRDDTDPTRLVFPGGAFRKAMDTAALDIPGCSKAQIGRLVRVVDYNVSIFGVPFICCMPVRQAGIQKTPDIRTRCILPRWCCQLRICFASPLLREKSILSLLDHAGHFIGVGDGRGEKGSTLSCGCFRQVGPGNPDPEEAKRWAEWLAIRAHGGTAVQDEALASPEPYDLTGDNYTRDLLKWFDEELVRRDRVPAKAGNGRKGEKEEVAQ